MDDEIFQLKQVSGGCEDISLIGVEVTSQQYGTGTVIDPKMGSRQGCMASRQRIGCAQTSQGKAV